MRDDRAESDVSDESPGKPGRDWRARPLHAATDRAPVGVGVLDRELRFVYANAALADINGVPIEQTLGRTVREVLPPASAALAELTARRVLETGAPVHVVPPALESGVGHIARAWSATYYPVFDDAGAIVGVAGTVFDTTERVQRQARERFLAEAGAILASSLDYQATLETLVRLAVPFLADLCMVDLKDDGVSDGEPGRMRRVAVAHADPRTEPLALRLREHPAPEVDGDHPVARVVRMGEPFLMSDVTDEFVARMARSADHLQTARALHYRSVLAVPLVSRNRILGAISFMITDSDRRYTSDDLPLAREFARRAAAAADNARLYEAERAARAEAERLRQTAEHANLAKTQFLAAMSHELRTPLNAIGGYAELLGMGLRGPVTPQQQDDLERITRSQRHLLAVITDILNFARVDAGRVEYRMQRVAVAQVIAELRSLVAPQLEHKSLTLEVGECDPAIAVRADREKLRQVLLNLVANAIKFTGAGGRITITCVEDTAAGSATIRVRDTGVGIPADRLESIFEPFVQLHRTLSQPVEGTGLGLAISRDLARGMDGDLTAESVEGAGATFTLTLPIDC